MKLIEQINLDFLEARKSKNNDISLLLSTLKGEIERKKTKTNEDNDIITIIKKMIDNCIVTNTKQSIDESKYLQKYLPTLLTESEIETILFIFINEGLNTLPLLMRKFQEQYKGKADNKMVTNIINKLLNENRF